MAGLARLAVSGAETSTMRHEPAATGAAIEIDTEEHTEACAIVAGTLGGRRVGLIEQPADQPQPDYGGGHLRRTFVMANAVEAGWQAVEQETADELLVAPASLL